MSVEIRLPLLQTYVDRTGPVFKDYVWLMIQHLLGDFIPFIEAFEQLGLRPEDTFIIGIPYSSRQEVVEKLKDRFTISMPSFPIDTSVEVVLRQALDHSRNQEKQLVIVEDGGYISVLLHTQNDLLSKCVQCKGIVEQTKQGIWRAADLQLRIPLCTVAENELKEKIEAPVVGEAIARNIVNLLRHQGFLAGKKALVVGYGSIGEAAAEALRRQNAIVMVSESLPVRRLVARFKGFETGDLLGLLPNCDLVIGTTGTCTIGTREIPLLRDGAVLINASSKRVEINVGALEQSSQRYIGTECGGRYTLIGGQDVLLLGDGFPINFLDESVPDRIFDLILTELLMCTVYLVCNDLQPGIYRKCVEEQEIADTFHKIHFSDQ